MRKIYLTLIALLTTAWAWADPVSSVSQLSNTKAYTIGTARGAWTLNSAGSTIASTKSTNGTVDNSNADQSAEAQEFAIYLYDGNYFIYNLKAKGFVVLNVGATQVSSLLGTPIAFETTGNASYPLKAGTLLKDRYANNNNSGGINIDTWKTTDGGNSLAIEEARDLTADEISEIDALLAAAPMNSHKAYTITANRGTWCANAAGTSLTTTTANASYAAGYNQFALVRLDNVLNIYNVGTKKFIKKDGSLVEGRGDEVAIRLSGDESRPYMFYFTSGNIYFNMQTSGSYSMNQYATPDDGNKQSLAVVDIDVYDDAQTEYNRTADITYNLMYEGEKVATSTVTSRLGTDLVVPSDIDKGLFSYTYSPAGVAQSNATTITVTATWAGPFEISPDYVGATWYNMYVRDQQHYIAYSEAESYTPYAATEEELKTKALQWAFVGNPFKGIKVINREAGRNMSWSDGNGNAVMREGETLWDIRGRNGGFQLRVQGTDYKYINQAGGTNGSMKFWDSANNLNDNGSTFWVQEADVEKTTITYDVTLNGTKVYSATAQAVIGDPVPYTKLPESLQKDYIELEVDDTDHIIAGNDIIGVTATWNGPVKLSSSFDDAVWYYAKLRSSKYLRADEANKDSDGRYTTSTTNEATDVYKWAFVGNPFEGFTIVNKGAGAGKYLYRSSDVVPAMQAVEAPLSDNDALWAIAPSTNATGGFTVRSWLTANLYVNDAGNNGNLGLWNSSYGKGDAGSAWKVEEVPVSVTYRILYDGKEVASAVVEAYVGDAVSVPASLQRDFLNYHSDVETVGYNGGTIDFSATWDGPFELSADFASAHWYDMAVRSTWYVTSDNKATDGALLTVNANAMGLAEDAYQWTFVGDPYHIRLYNKAEGESKVYAWTSTANGSIPAFVDAEGNENFWWIRKSTSGISESFQLTIPSYGYQVNQYGGAGGSLKIWADPRTHDAGSAFTVFDVPNNFAEYVVAEITPYMETTATGYFTFTEAAKSAIGYKEEYKTSCPYATYKQMKQALMDALADNGSLVLPETGYYRIKSNLYGSYIRQTGAVVRGNDNGNADKDAASVIYLERGEGGKYSMKLQGSYIQAPAASSQDAAKGETPVYFKAEMAPNHPGLGTFWGNEAVEFSALHSQMWGGYYNQKGNLVGWERNAEASWWKLEQATDFELTVGSTGYSTLWVPFPVTPSEGESITAYTGTTKQNSLSLTELEGTIPAGTAVVLSGKPGTYTFTIAEDVAAVEGNALLGSDGTVSGGDGIYALAQKNGDVGFYPVSESITIPANKAYLNRSGSSVKGFTFSFDDDATGIDGMTNEELRVKNGSAVFNLAGQRISKLQKGINIINGKKVLY